MGVMKMRNKQVISKAYTGDSVSIVYASSNAYLAVLSVAIQSLLDHCSPDRQYDVLVLSNELEKADQKNLVDLTVCSPNITIRVFNPRTTVLELKKSYIGDQPWAYYRLALPWILTEYNKILCLGADTIVRCDPAEIYDYQISERNYVAGFLIDESEVFTETKSYGRRKDETISYLDTDFCVFQLDRMRENLSMKSLLLSGYPRNYWHIDRSALSVILEGHIDLLDDSWNVRTSMYQTKWKRLGRTAALQNAKIIHFLGASKPWCEPRMFLAEDWWYFARKSDYYEELLRRLCIQEPDTRSTIRKIADKIFPKGSKRRWIIKKIFFTIFPFKASEV